MMDSLMPCIHGYDNDPREIYCIPEVRRFAQEFHRIWPHWIFFFRAVPGSCTLKVFTACCLGKLNVVQREVAGVTILDPDPAELTQFLVGDLPSFRRMCDRAKVFPDLRRARAVEVFSLFRLRVPAAAFDLRWSKVHKAGGADVQSKDGIKRRACVAGNQNHYREWDNSLQRSSRVDRHPRMTRTILALSKWSLEMSMFKPFNVQDELPEPAARRVRVGWHHLR
ncbi:MAG: hypothetical protein ACLQVY_26265 [Limisphaerales bacterium]